MGNILFNSIRFRIATASRPIFMLYILTALLVWADWAFGVVQFIYFYKTYGQTDVSPEFFFTLFPILLSSWLFVASLILSAILLRFRLYKWMKHMIVYARYTPRLSPSYAGMLFDYRLGDQEAYATLLDLHFRGIIQLHSSHGSLSFTVVRPEDSTITDTEKMIIDNGQSSNASVHQVLNLAFKLLQESNYFLRLGLNHAIFKKTNYLIVIFMSFALLWLTVQTIGAFNDPTAFITLIEPRYEVHPAHFIVIALITLVGILMICTGFFPRMNSNQYTTEAITWTEVAGWKTYIERVYIHRMSSNGILTQSPKEIKEVLPYMIAFGIIKTNNLDIPKLLAYYDEQTKN